MPERPWRFYLHDMLEFSEKILGLAEDFDYDNFSYSSANYDEAIRYLISIGDAATDVPNEIQLTFKKIPWQEIMITRHRLINDNLKFDHQAIEHILQQVIPKLTIQLKVILK